MSLFKSLTSLSLPRASLTFSTRSARPAITPSAQRHFSRASTLLAKDPPAPGNQPPSAKSAGRDTHVSTDQQSSASSDEHKSGDDHPAKQPDPQAESDRSTGFGNVKEVKGGKEGLGARSDKNSDGSDK